MFFDNFNLSALSAFMHIQLNFKLTIPQIWKFSAHKPPNLEIFRSQAPFSEANVSSQAPHFGNPGRTPLPEKKLSAPPPPGIAYFGNLGRTAHISLPKDKLREKKNILLCRNDTYPLRHDPKDSECSNLKEYFLKNCIFKLLG